MTVQLSVDELVANDIGQDEDGHVRLLVLGIGEVGRDWLRVSTGSRAVVGIRDRYSFQCF